MGRDKAALDWQGVTLLERAVRVLAELLPEVHVAVAADQVAEPLRRRFRLLVDPLPEAGPAAALLAAHRHEPASAWLVLACDLPRVDVPLLRQLLLARDPDVGATAFRVPGRDVAEPLCALYEPATLARLAGPAAGTSLPGPRWLLANGCKLLDLPDAGMLANLNTLADYRAAAGGAGPWHETGPGSP
jgi:molybdenum cofactor guanylyltransferase